MRLNWDAVGERFYDIGVDRGVLYLPGVPGVAWPGLVSVTESPDGGTATPYYLDGIKYQNVPSSEEFKATIESFSVPKEFEPCNGRVSIQNGLIVTNQRKKTFGFSYRTRFGNDFIREDFGYKIHLVYNALPTESSRTFNSFGSTSTPTVSKIDVTTLPPALSGYKPTAHLVIDSMTTPPNLLSYIEDILYGDESQSPSLPTPSELVTIFNSEGPIIQTNLATNPKALAAGTGWISNNGAYWTVAKGTAIADHPLGLSTAAKSTVVSESTTVLSMYGIDGYYNNTISRGFGCWVWIPKDGDVSCYLTDDQVGTKKITTVPAETWTWVESLAPGTGIIVIVAICADGTTGDIAYATGCNTCVDSVPTSYFDGDTTDANGYYYSWTGTSGLSTSVINSWLD